MQKLTNDKINRFIGGQHIPYSDAMELAREVRLLRQAFSQPDCWEIAGCIFSTEEEALKPGFRGTPEPLFSKPEGYEHE